MDVDDWPLPYVLEAIGFMDWENEQHARQQKRMSARSAVKRRRR